ncbi:glycosyltransferase involved in cell wall biosynthesis [Brevibacterium sanguinis]|uniref:Glycosyltransferase involved in cell wall biosynthesis n=2 Tax=Brevibacterium TaxID=1696 RepID=A0A366IFU5_9MICO|nr:MULTISPECIES: glycosyltransferase [Brevibacterium]RBP62360.1 glycosyltransferase involved in cell wall biosynthesis [Brevibacterium sanguinis]RBP68749.1 glycosyltransferase involved in cell wall biosynthesis [Brevibacterium celere]
MKSHEDAARPPVPVATRERSSPPHAAQVDLVVPVHNEESTLERSIHTLIDHVADSLHEMTIVIADNASTDATGRIAEELARSHSNVRAVRLEEKGRGRALRTVWLESSAEVLVYTDVDLATDLALLDPMVTAISAGTADVAIAGRLHPQARVQRGVGREIISRCYNRLLSIGLGAEYSDAQCGLKAISRPAAQALLPVVEDDGWFFDTELLTLAQWSGLRIREFWADWTADPDSSVDVVRTAVDDFKGILRLRRDARRGRLPLARIGARLGRAPAVPNTGAQILHFVDVGIVCTLVYSLLFWFASGLVSAGVANVAALLISTLLGTALNRRHTFGLRSPQDQLAHHLKDLVAFGVGWAMTSAALLATSDLNGAWTLAVLTVANLVATVVRFTLQKLWVFAREGSLR